MKYIIKPHARKRMRERSISERIVQDALDNPTKVGYDTNGRILIKRLYHKNSKERLLLVVCDKVADALEIITIIDTYKIKKYLLIKKS